MMAPNSIAFLYSSYGVSLEENMMSSPVIPTFSLKINSAIEEQSAPIPISFIIFIMYGFGVAFTAKYCLNPGAQLKASKNARMLSIIPFAS